MTAVRRWSWRSGAPIRAGLLALIWLYRMTVGQLLGGQCRFYPSCSAYAEAAIRQVGWFRGSALALWRVLRCNPWSAGGVDHPPRDPEHVHLYDSVNGWAYDDVAHRPLDVPTGHPPGDVEASPTARTDGAEVRA